MEEMVADPVEEVEDPLVDLCVKFVGRQVTLPWIVGTDLTNNSFL